LGDTTHMFVVSSRCLWAGNRRVGILVFSRLKKWHFSVCGRDPTYVDGVFTTLLPYQNTANSSTAVNCSTMLTLRFLFISFSIGIVSTQRCGVLKRAEARTVGFALRCCYRTVWAVDCRNVVTCGEQVRSIPQTKCNTTAYV
jgi:hypothetical protein